MNQKKFLDVRISVSQEITNWTYEEIERRLNSAFSFIAFKVTPLPKLASEEELEEQVERIWCNMAGSLTTNSERFKAIACSLVGKVGKPVEECKCVKPEEKKAGIPNWAREVYILIIKEFPDIIREMREGK